MPWVKKNAGDVREHQVNFMLSANECAALVAAGYPKPVSGARQIVRAWIAERMAPKHDVTNSEAGPSVVGDFIGDKPAGECPNNGATD